MCSLWLLRCCWWIVNGLKVETIFAPSQLPFAHPPASRFNAATHSTPATLPQILLFWLEGKMAEAETKLSPHYPGAANTKRTLITTFSASKDRPLFPPFYTLAGWSSYPSKQSVVGKEKCTLLRYYQRKNQKLLPPFSRLLFPSKFRSISAWVSPAPIWNLCGIMM